MEQHPFQKLLSQKWKTALEDRVFELRLTRGKHLLYPDDLCKHVYFIHTGFFRLYQFNAHGQEETVDFACPGQMVTSVKSFIKQERAIEGIICESDAQVYRISYHDWHALEDLSTEFLHLAKLISIEYLMRLKDQQEVFRTSNARNRYLYLCATYPGITNVVSQKNIASYIGVTSPTLSNLIRTIIKKPK